MSRSVTGNTHSKRRPLESEGSLEMPAGQAPVPPGAKPKTSAVPKPEDGNTASASGAKPKRTPGYHQDVCFTQFSVK